MEQMDLKVKFSMMVTTFSVKNLLNLNHVSSNDGMKVVCYIHNQIEAWLSFTLRKDVVFDLSNVAAGSAYWIVIVS